MKTQVMSKNINDIIIFMQNNNLDYKNIELLSNFCIFINKDYTSSHTLKLSVKQFDRRMSELNVVSTSDSNNTIMMGVNSLNFESLQEMISRLGIQDSNLLTELDIDINSNEEEEAENYDDEDWDEEDYDEFEDPFN